MEPPASERQVHVLYIVYWGALEPLGRALVLPSVTRLSALGARITLVTFDKPDDLARADQVKEVGDSLREAGVRWLPLRYHKQPKLPATAFDFAHGVARGIVERVRERPDIVHARTFIGGLTGLAVARLTRARLIYHNEGFYPDEQVDGGVWRAGSMPHRIARRLEERLYTRADAVFSLSNAGKEIIESIDGVRAKGTPVIVVPSAVDLDRFPMAKRVRRDDGSLRLVYVGSVGGRYLLDRVGRFVYVAHEERPETHLQLLTPADPDLVREMLDSSGLTNDAWSSKFVQHERLPDELGREDAGFFFLAGGLGAAGFSPTKVGEYWAMGLPVISTSGMADVDEIIRQERVGVVVRDHTDAAYRESVAELVELLDDPELTARCRQAAERHYGLDAACRRQMEIYQTLARDRHQRG
jgi:glycosyltransferase involved in cell wall biosynthesis